MWYGRTGTYLEIDLIKGEIDKKENTYSLIASFAILLILASPCFMHISLGLKMLLTGIFVFIYCMILVVSIKLRKIKRI